MGPRQTRPPRDFVDFILGWLQRLCWITALAIAVTWPAINQLYIEQHHPHHPQRVFCLSPDDGTPITPACAGRP